MERPGEAVTRTTCPYCGVGCGVLASVGPDGAVSIKGDPDHPANYGRLCSKGSALAETISLEGRMLDPEIEGRAADWDEALDLVASRFSEAIAAHGPDSVAFYVSGQLLTEDYYVANKLMKGFVGTANIDTNSRLCMSSSVAGHRRAFGSDTVPGTYEDLEQADLLVLVGSNLAWCHPVLYQRVAAAKAARPEMRIVLVDPRRTMTADIADLHLPIAADGDVALFAGLLAHLAASGRIDQAYVAAHTNGLNAALAAAGAPDLDAIAARTGLAPDLLARFYDLFAATERTVTVYSQGVNQSASGTDKVNAIINCHLATGRIGRPGMGPFSITGQPNAMGGREVGGLANMLAAHMDLENPEDRDRVQRFWGSPAIADRPGLKAVDMFRAVADGRIRALWIMATNPVDSMPDADAVETAIRACPFVVVSDVIHDTDTVRHAHVRLPALAWGEKDGTVTNSERRISRQRAFLPAPGQARPDWQIIADVARRMGFSDAFSYIRPAEIFAEHAALSGFENDGARNFDIGGLADLDQAGFDGLEPVQWPQPPTLPLAGRVDPRACPGGGVGGEPPLPGREAPARPPSGLPLRSGHLPREGEGSGPPRAIGGTTRFFAQGGFYTPDRRARFVPVRPEAATRTSPDFPLILNTGRIRDHWHTMTRTGRSPRLSQHLAEPYAEIHPGDALRLGIADADLVRVASAGGSVLVRAWLSARQSPGSVFVPMHWTDQFAADARVDRVVRAITDPHSGQPASKNVAVRVQRYPATAYGFAVLAERPESLAAEYWALARCEGGWRVELAFAEALDWAEMAGSLFQVEDAAEAAETLAYHDVAGRQHRFACFAGERLLGALYIAAEPVMVSRNWACEQLVATHLGQRARMAVVVGRPGAGIADRGATICSCFGVGANQIAAAVAEGCYTVETVGAATRAGTNCGSCRAEIRGIIEAQALQAAE